MKPQTFGTLLLVFVLLTGAALAQQPGTIFIVRHAERQASAPVPSKTDDPQLTDVGRRRANCLARTLKDSDITTVITSGITRTNQTAEPLATTLHLEIKKLPSISETVTAAKQAVASGSVLIVGHSNTVPEIVKGLTGANVTVPDDSFDQMFVVTPGTPAHLSTIHYCPAER